MGARIPIKKPGKATIEVLTKIQASTFLENLGNNPLNNQLSDMFGKLSKLKEIEDV